MAAPIDLDLSLSRRQWVFIVLGAIVLVSLPSFLDHVRWFLQGQANQMIVQGRWDLVAINVAVFLVFIIPLAIGMRKRIEWQSTSMGIYAAFIVSLFVEMYGVPLTVYLTSAAVFSGGAAPTQDVIISFTVLGQPLVMTFWKLVGAAISVLGMVVIAVGWTTLHRSDDELVTTGIYAYSRHPQYVGFILIIVGWFVHWPTPLTLAMVPVLVYVYYKLAIVEEREVRETISDTDAYDRYVDAVPRFV